MASEDVEGQEAATLPSEGGVRITPFNLQEEMEEGHFDADGNYFLNRDAQIRDSWLDNIDWVKIRERPPDQRPPSDSEEEDSLGQTPMSTQALRVGRPDGGPGQPGSVSGDKGTVGHATEGVGVPDPGTP